MGCWVKVGAWDEVGGEGEERGRVWVIAAREEDAEAVAAGLWEGG